MEDPFWAVCDFDQRYRDEIIAKNEALHRVYDRMVADGMTNTYFLTKDKVAMQDNEGFSDGIHYTDLAFRYYCDNLIPILRKHITSK